MPIAIGLDSQRQTAQGLNCLATYQSTGGLVWSLLANTTGCETTGRK